MSDGLGDRTAVSPAEFSDSPLSRVLRQPLILGLFLPVQSGGWSASLLAAHDGLDVRLQRGPDQASRTAGVRPRLRSRPVDEQGRLWRHFKIPRGLARSLHRGRGSQRDHRPHPADLDHPRAVRPVASPPPRKIRGDDRPYLRRTLGDQRRHRLCAERGAHVRRASRSSTTAATRWPENSPTSSPGCGARPRI